MIGIFPLNIGDVVMEMDHKDHLILNQLVTQLERIVSDHETRIRYLERMIFYGIGGLAIAKYVFDSYMMRN